MAKQQARVLKDFTRGAMRFVAKEVRTHTAQYGDHSRLEHRLNGRVVSTEAWLDAYRTADPDGYAAAFGSTDD